MDPITDQDIAIWTRECNYINKDMKVLIVNKLDDFEVEHMLHRFVNQLDSINAEEIYENCKRMSFTSINIHKLASIYTLECVIDRGTIYKNMSFDVLEIFKYMHIYAHALFYHQLIEYVRMKHGTNNAIYSVFSDAKNNIDNRLCHVHYELESKIKLEDFMMIRKSVEVSYDSFFHMWNLIVAIRRSSTINDFMNTLTARILTIKEDIAANVLVDMVQRL